MKKYTQEELEGFKNDLLNSMSPEQLVMYEALTNEVIIKIQELGDGAKLHIKESRVAYEKLEEDFDKLKGSWDLMVEQMRKLGINIVS